MSIYCLPMAGLKVSNACSFRKKNNTNEIHNFLINIKKCAFHQLNLRDFQYSDYLDLS